MCSCYNENQKENCSNFCQYFKNCIIEEKEDSEK